MGCKPVLTWRYFSAETQPSPLEAVEEEREELCSDSRGAPMQVKELGVEGSHFQSYLLDLGSAELCWHFPLGSWKLGFLLFGSSQTVPSLLLSTASYLQSLLAGDCMQLLLEPFSPIAGELLSIPARSFISQHY